MKKIKIQTPAKINLTLEILNKREDGFHNLQSIMQTISLFDYLTIEIIPAEKFKIDLSGNSREIPYDETNIVYKAVLKYIQRVNLNPHTIKIYIEKNIPVCAGLAGGSSNGAGIFYGLNKLFGNILNTKETDELCSSLGSDINFCYHGGCMLCTSRGEITNKLPFVEQDLSVIKPKNFGVSTKEAYSAFAQSEDKSYPDNTSKLIKLLDKGIIDKSLLFNSFEKALFSRYDKLKEIKTHVKNSLMSGSGSAFFVLEKNIETDLNKNEYIVFENLKTINSGVKEVD